MYVHPGCQHSTVCLGPASGASCCLVQAGNESGSRSSSASGASSPTGLTVCATCAQLIDLVLDTNTVLNKVCCQIRCF